MAKHLSNTPPRVWVAAVHRESGVGAYAASSEEALLRELAQICKASWDHALARSSALPTQPPEQDRETVALYFEAVDETLALGSAPLIGAAFTVPAVREPVADSAGERRLLALEFISDRPLEDVHDAYELNVSDLVARAIDGELSMTVLADVKGDVDEPTLMRGGRAAATLRRFAQTLWRR